MEQVNRKCQVVLLETELKYDDNKYITYLSNRVGKMLYFGNLNNDFYNTNDAKHKHLYILSSEEIKKENWVIDNNILCKAIEDFPSTTWCNKVIATTDFILSLPKINQDFINKYISEYNKGNIIKEVMIEYINKYEVLIGDHGRNNPLIPKLRKDNTIIIHPIKDSFTKEELNSKLEEYKNTFDSRESYYRSKLTQFVEWFKQQEF